MESEVGTISYIKNIPIIHGFSLILFGAANAQIIYSCIDPTLHPYMLFMYANLLSFLYPLGIMLVIACLISICMIINYSMHIIVKCVFSITKYCIANYVCCANLARYCIDLNKEVEK